jgi:hypothetical protein
MWDVEALFQDFQDAESLSNLILGQGHHFGWTGGPESSTGLMPDPLPSTAVGVGVKFTGGSSARFCGGVQGDIFLRYDTQLIDSDWTIIWMESGSAVCVRRSDGAGFFNGIRDDETGRINGPSRFVADVVDGSAVFGVDAALASGQFMFPADVFPWFASDGMIAEWSANLTTVGSKYVGDTPVLRIAGDIIEEDNAFCVGEITGEDYIQKPKNVPGVGWVNNAKIVKFALMETPETWRFPQ